MTPIYELVDVEDLSKRFPLVYDVPPLTERLNLSEGAHVELIIIFTNKKNHRVSKHIWAKVMSKETNDDIYYGVSESKQKFIPIEIGDEIQFSSNHIMKIIKEEK